MTNNQNNPNLVREPREPGDRPEHLAGKSSTFDFVSKAVYLSCDLEACCQLIATHMRDGKLGYSIKITKEVLEKYKETVEELLAMDVDTTLELDEWQLGNKPDEKK